MAHVASGAWLDCHTTAMMAALVASSVLGPIQGAYLTFKGLSGFGPAYLEDYLLL